MRRLLPALLFLLPGVLGAQAATYKYINQSANPSPPWLTALNLPKVGTTFTVQVRGHSRRVSSWLAVGAKNPNVVIPTLGGVLFTSAEFVVRTPLSSTSSGWPGMATVSFAIPNSSQLLGATFYQQVLNSGFYQFGWGWTYRLSRGGVGVIGK